jgi:ABC-2 type transport system ATP-binding protein
MSGWLVEVEGLTRQFARNTALEQVDFRAREGFVYGLVGANGAGKTTLLRHLLGLLRAETGTVRVFGLDPVRHPVEVLRRVGYLSEERELPEWMLIEELMRYTQAYYPSWDVGYARELLSTFGLDVKKKIKELSKGMRAQVGLVAAVAHRPELLILDEPSTGLDAAVRQDILDAIVRTVAEDGRTVIFSSHLLDEVERMSDHITMMHEARVVLDGRLEEVRGAHQVSHLRFATRLARPPVIEGALSIEGDGRSWSVIHNGSPDRFRAPVAIQQGEVVQSREATLEEIFVARVGRTPAPVEVA